MVVALKFKIQHVGGSLNLVSCPDPEYAEWEWMVPLQVALSGRGVQQGRLRCTLHWDVMSDGDFADLLDEWRTSRGDGYRLASIVVPTFEGSDNSSYGTYVGSGSPGGYIRMLMPKGQREVLNARNISVVFEDIAEPS
jgi:hypothetical protein